MDRSVWKQGIEHFNVLTWLCTFLSLADINGKKLDLLRQPFEVKGSPEFLLLAKFNQLLDVRFIVENQYCF